MKKVAIVVQRCHESIVGGSETLAWQYATLLKERYEVEVLTTTATDAAYWSNVLPAGSEIRDGINIRRFHVDIGYSPYRTDLFTRMLLDHAKFKAGRHASPNGETKHIPWSIPLQEELVRRIGPYSESLLQFLRSHWTDYRAVMVVTYLYPTGYFSLLEIPKGRALFVPTLHDEQPAYLSVYKHAARRAHSLIWLTDAERRLGVDLWGDLPGRVVAMAIDANPRQPVKEDTPYALYCGRIDPNKGCGELFDYFIRYKEQNPSTLRLVLTGKDDIQVPDHPQIEFRGFVSDEEKLSLMAGAAVYVMPSSKESFSIVALEAMAQGTPALVNEQSDVLVDHVNVSGAGHVYRDYDSFASRLNEIISNPDRGAEMGKLGREYVISRYTPKRVSESLFEAVESCPEPEQAPLIPVLPLQQPHQNGDSSSEQKTSPREVQLEDLSKSPPLPLPAGWSETDLRRMVGSILVEGAPADEMQTYADSDFRRFVYTLGLVPERSGQKILELGANPYFITTLLKKFRNADLHLANFFGVGESDGVQQVTINETGETIAYAYKQFNIEEDKFPYESETFDLVLFCEIIEHLLSDPVHALLEIRRVLKPTGTLVLTTPNAVRLDNVRKVIGGENFYDPYSGYGPYGRHNREYTQEELFLLLSENGFSVGTMFTADVHPGHTGSPVSLNEIAPLVKDRKTDLGQYIFCQSTINRDSKLLSPVRPPAIYRSLHDKSQPDC
jgi:glycosyltransferase involved in cell wall biosynthesis/SAM-dependent methyltransferase